MYRSETKISSEKINLAVWGNLRQVIQCVRNQESDYLIHGVSTNTTLTQPERLPNTDQRSSDDNKHRGVRSFSAQNSNTLMSLHNGVVMVPWKINSASTNVTQSEMLHPSLLQSLVTSDILSYIKVLWIKVSNE